MRVENKTKVSLITSSEISESLKAALRAFFPIVNMFKLLLKFKASLIEECHIVSMDKLWLSIVP